MNKLFETLVKPSKWILIIGSFVFALWFAIKAATSIDGEFMSVMANIIILFVGTGLLVAVPILLLFKKDEQAKTVFLILVGYWLLSTIQSWLFYSETFASNNAPALAIVAGIFTFIAALGLVGILVLIVLEFALKNKSLRFITIIVLLGVIGAAFIAGILLFIYAIQMNAGWVRIVDFAIDFMFLPILICFGYLYFFGVPKKAK